MSQNKKNIPKARDRTKSVHVTLDGLEEEISNLLEKRKEIEGKINQIHNDFKSEVVGGDDNKKENGNLSILGDIKDSQSEINRYYCELLQSSDENKSIKDKIDSFKKRIEEIKGILEGVEQFAKNSKTSISTMEGECGTKKGKIEEILSESNTLIEEIRELHDEIKSFNDKIDKREEQIKKQNDDIEKSQATLDKLNEASQKLFEEWTGQSLHNAFKKEAKKKKWSHTIYVICSILALLGGIIAFFLLPKAGFTGYDLWFARVFISIPVGFMYYLCYSTSSTFLQLAEEYQHKASIAESLSGYRKLWNLEHKDDEYREFFDKTINDIIANPFNNIKERGKTKVPSKRSKVSLSEKDSSAN